MKPVYVGLGGVRELACIEEADSVLAIGAGQQSVHRSARGADLLLTLQFQKYVKLI